MIREPGGAATKAKHEAGAADLTATAATPSRLPTRWRAETARRPDTGVLLLLLLLACVAYLPALHAGYVWDDPFYVEHNRTLHSPLGLQRIWLVPSASPQYYPLVFTSYWLEYRLWGTAAAGYHAVNIVLHALNAGLVYLVLLRLRVPGAALAAAIFAVHPVHVESVVWISERKNVLSALFALLTTLGWLRFLHDRRAATYCLTFVLFAAAVLSKTQVALLPLLLLLLAWREQPRIWLRRAGQLLPHLCLGAALSLVTAWREHLLPNPELPIAPLSLIERGLVAGRAFWFYFGKLIWPADLMTIYPRWQVDPHAAWQYLFPVAAAIVVVLPWALRHRIGTGPLLAVAAFLVGVGPALGLIDFDFMRLSFVADHLQYLASIGVIALIGAAAAQAGRQGWAASHRPLCAAVVLTLAALTWKQSGLYVDEVTLSRANLEKNPDSAVVRNHLGAALLAAGQAREALPHFAAALQLNPNFAEAHFNWGNALVQLRRPDEAAAQFAEAVRISPEYTLAYVHWGNLDLLRGNVDAAVEHFSVAVQRRPGSAPAQTSLCVALLLQKKAALAVDHCASAVRSQPDLPEARNNLGRALLDLDRPQEAATEFETAARFSPAMVEAYENWGLALQQQGDLDGAAARYEEALRLEPNRSQTRDRLGTVLFRKGRLPEAIEQFTAAIEADPRNAAAHDHLGLALGQSGRSKDAIEHLSAAVRLRPDNAEYRDHLAAAMRSRKPN